jgi:beta-aspartyl-dipeptidase (metallo-type)
MLLIKNANVFAPEPLEKKDILIGGGKILAIEKEIAFSTGIVREWDAKGIFTLLVREVSVDLLL